MSSKSITTSAKMVLALNNPQRPIFHKTNKSYLTNWVVTLIFTCCSWLWPHTKFHQFFFMWYFDLRPGQNCHLEWCTGRRWHILMAVMRGNRVGRNWLMKWDEVKKNSHGTLIDWCTGREWPVNSMTVISAWWWSNMRFQRSSRRLSGRGTII